MLPQSTDDWALGLHSCRALSSQPQGHSTQKKSFFATFPLTNHIPVFRGLNCRFQPSLSVRIRAARANSSTSCNLFNPCNSFNSFGCGSAALCQSVSIGVHPRSEERRVGEECR